MDMFVTQKMIDDHEVVEGDPVLFSGLFVQYAAGTTLEPVVRSGTVAMLPPDLIETTLHHPGHIYLAEAHAFHGNSGSPMFVDVNKFKTGIGFEYRFLGIVAGEVLETTDLSLQTATTYHGSVSANSDISMIVPADEIRKIVLSPRAQHLRDAEIAAQPK